MALSTTKISEKQVRDALGETTLGGINVYQFVMVDISELTDNIFQSTGIEVVGILGTPAIKQLGMIIDLKRGIIILNNN